MATTLPWTGVGLSPNHLFGKTQLQPHLAHLVLKQVSERFKQVERHLGWQTANIVMGLYFG